VNILFSQIMAPGMHSKRNALVFYFVKCDALRLFYYNLFYMVLGYVGHMELLYLKNSGHGYMLCMHCHNIVFTVRKLPYVSSPTLC